jgi:hypothetical protein
MSMPKSTSPAAISVPPMVKTAILPASAMTSPVKPYTDVKGLNWTQITGNATQVAAAADGSIWALSTTPSGPDKNIWHFANGTWANIGGQASAIAVAPNGTLYAVTSTNGVYSYNGTWTALGGGATSVSTDSSNNVYVTSNANAAGTDQAIWKYSGGAWTQQPGQGVALAGNFDTGTYNVTGGGGTGTVAPGGGYLLNSAGSIYYANTSLPTAQLSGKASAIAPTTVGGVFALDYPASASGNNLWYYNLITGIWTAQAGQAVSISSNAGKLYAVGASGAIYSTPVTNANVVVNPDFETGNLNGWYPCYAAHNTLTATVDQNPALDTPQPTFTQAPTTTVSPAPTADVTVQTSLPASASPHSGTYAAQIGYINSTVSRKKGLLGLCQDLTVPATRPMFTVWVWEGGNVAAFSTADTEVDLFQGATWTATSPTGGMITTSSPTKTYFAETNCYNNTNTSGGSSTFGSCATGSPAQPPNSHGGQWRLKGPYDLSTYAGQSVTIMLGLWSSSTSSGYYDYLYVDDASLSGQ